MRFTLLLLISLITSQSFAQKTNIVKKTDAKPKLVVGIVVDQMRWDYINKFKPFFKTQNGFLKFMNQGASCNNNLISYLPTITACGHTAVYLSLIHI